MRGITPEKWVPYHYRVLQSLSALGQIKSVRTHVAGQEYTSLMSCFLMHSVSGAQSLLALYKSDGVEWFPVAVGYVIARTMFEVDVTAHYITLLPEERTRQYILFEHILNKQAMDACDKYRKSDDPSWREAMQIEWSEKWMKREQEVNDRFAEYAPLFTSRGKKGRPFQNWSGKSIRALSVEVGHEEAYDTFYSELSSFTHVDVNMANRFLRIQPDGLHWSQHTNWHDVGMVLHNAATFLTCYLKLFGEQFGGWNDAVVDACWNVET